MIKVIEFVSLASITKQTFVDGFGIFYLFEAEAKR